MFVPTKPKFFVDVDGNYIGSFSGLEPIRRVTDDVEEIIFEGEFPEIPKKAKEVPFGPDKATDKWDFKKKQYIIK